MTPRPDQRSTVIIQDRSRLFRESLRLVLDESSQVRVIDTVATEADLLAVSAHTPADAVLLEAVAVPWDVPDVVRRLTALVPRIHPVGTFPPALQRHSIDGVVCVPRSASGSTFAGALAGEPADPEDDDLGVGEVRGDPAKRLTQRELQVLALISSGLTTGQIAQRLRISAKTVESRRQTMFTKLGVQSQSHAVSVAMRSGLLGHRNGATPAGGAPAPVEP